VPTIVVFCMRFKVGFVERREIDFRVILEEDGWLCHCTQECAARLLALPAGGFAHPAVSVRAGMAFAFVAAASAYDNTGLEEWPHDAGVKFGRSTENRSSGTADVGAVQAQPNALDHVGEVVLAQIRVRVDDASLNAVVQRIDRVAEDAAVDTRIELVRVKDLLCEAHRALQFALNMPTWVGVPAASPDSG
jgi:hypothetical protein